MTEETQSSRPANDDRFYVAAAKHGLFQEWGKDDVSSPLMSLKDAFVFSASVGWSIGRRVPLGKRQHVGFWRSFDQRFDVPILQAIAIAETSDPGCVANQGLVLTIAEEYANGGIDEVISHGRGDRERTLAALASFILGEERSPVVDAEAALTGAADEGASPDDPFEEEG
jgi:dnd system-associated protein 4